MRVHWEWGGHLKWISEEPEEGFAGEEKTGLQGGQAPGRLDTYGVMHLSRERNIYSATF